MSSPGTLSDTELATEIARFCEKLGISQDFSAWDNERLRAISLEVVGPLVGDEIKAARLVSKIRGLFREVDPSLASTPRTSASKTPRRGPVPTPRGGPSKPSEPASFAPPEPRDPTTVTEDPDGDTLIKDLHTLATLRTDGLLSEGEFLQFKSTILPDSARPTSGSLAKPEPVEWTASDPSPPPKLPPQSKLHTLSIAVFGASGDLAKKKTYPALFHLFSQGYLQPTTQIFGFARSPMSDQELRDRVRPFLEKESQSRETAHHIDAFLACCVYFSGNYDEPTGYISLARAMDASERKRGGVPGRVFYLALPPAVFPTVATQVKGQCMVDTSHGAFNRVVVEKPFGHDLESSEVLAGQLGALFTEDEVYRIDHYLGKELVQNLLVLRFTNEAFASTWNKEHISNVTISFKEPFGTEGRGGYFDESGIIRDILQNHLLQVMAIVAMEPPAHMSPELIRDEKTKVLEATRPVDLNDTVVGQYVADRNGNPGYKDDPGVPKNSITPTFAAMVLHVETERWKGVPFFLKAGKALNERKAEIRIQYKPPPSLLRSMGTKAVNELVIRLQPDEAIYLKINTKTPGLANKPHVTELDLTYSEKHPGVIIPDAYERLILDVINGDHQHFVRRDELVAAWKIFTPILHRLERAKITPVQYVYGSRGPTQSDDLMERYGFGRDVSYTWNKQ